MATDPNSIIEGAAGNTRDHEYVNPNRSNDENPDTLPTSPAIEPGKIPGVDPEVDPAIKPEIEPGKIPDDSLILHK